MLPKHQHKEFQVVTKLNTNHNTNPNTNNHMNLDMRITTEEIEDH